jgi:hypothetical protein
VFKEVINTLRLNLEPNHITELAHNLSPNLTFYLESLFSYRYLIPVRESGPEGYARKSETLQK